MLKNISIHASADNVDKNVDMYDAKNSFHAMAMCIHQTIVDADSVIEPLDLYRVVPTGLHGVPKTVIPIQACKISGNPKPHTSPKDYKVRIHADEVIKGEKDDLVWLIT